MDHAPVTAASGQVQVSFEYIGEGGSGDYDPKDPADAPMLRFYVSKKVGTEWEDAGVSYCTLIDERNFSREKLQTFCQEMADLLANLPEAAWHRHAQAISWVSEQDLAADKSVRSFLREPTASEPPETP